MIASQRSAGTTVDRAVCAATAAAISFASPLPAFNAQIEASTGNTEGSGSGGTLLRERRVAAGPASVALSNSAAA